MFHVDNTPRPLDAAELLEMALTRAGRLVDRGIGKRDRVGVIGPNVAEWCAWSYATWLLGATVVGLPAPLRLRDREAIARQIQAMAEVFECATIASHERFLPVVDPQLALCWDDLDSNAGALDPSRVVEGDEDDLAQIVPTSGSTSAPKGVGRTYRTVNELHLAAYFNRANKPLVRYLTYSPMAHGTGSVALLAPIEPWLEAHVLPPERFARDPGELFRLVGRHRIDTMMGTSSAVAAALRAIDQRPEGVDLSSLESCTLAFEMVDPDVLDRLIEVGARFGLRAEAVGVSYGLSEGGGTNAAAGARIRIDEIDLDHLVAHGVARSPAAAGSATKRVASCGTPGALMGLRIAGDDGPRQERHVGEVQFRGPGMMQGYVGATSEEAFTADGWLRTGDVGYLADGELFLTGRIKEVMMQQGKKYHPEDVEWAAARGAGVAPAECVAFTPVGADEGQIIVAVEVPATSGLADLEQRVRASVLNTVGIVLRTVVLVAPATLPKASTGKAQRLAARDQHARGELDVVSR